MNIFNQVQVRKPKKSKFDLSHERKFSTNFSKLTPILLQEIIPSDSFKVNSEMLIRLAPMKFPVMHRINAYVHYFFVPNRILWDSWEDFITGGEDGLSTPTLPTIHCGMSSSHSHAGSLWDHFGLPIDEADGDTGQRINALPFRAYSKIYNEYYRDQNLEEKIEEWTTGGSVSAAEIDIITVTRYRAWEHDYFTSCLPDAQKGGEVVLPVEGDGSFSPQYLSNSRVQTESGNVPIAGQLVTDGSGIDDSSLENQNGEDLRIKNLTDPQQVDFDSTNLTINDLRKAEKLQQWLEKSMRAGSRYAEALKSFFNVNSDDARLQRPEYLGGGKQNVVISEVLQSTETAEEPLGAMGGHGISVGGNMGFKKTFKEHGYVIGILSILPKSSYANQGIPRLFSKENKFDFPFPEFAQLGEQEVLNKEIYYDGTDTSLNEETFGYIPRYAEFKFINNSVHGQFRTTLINWTMARKFENRPLLNQEFISSEDATNDIFNVIDETEDKFFIQMYHKISAIRPLPFFGTPRL